MRAGDVLVQRQPVAGAVVQMDIAIHNGGLAFHQATARVVDGLGVQVEPEYMP